MNGHTQGPWGPISDEFGNCEMGVAWPGERAEAYYTRGVCVY